MYAVAAMTRPIYWVKRSAGVGAAVLSFALRSACTHKSSMPHFFLPERAKQTRVVLSSALNRLLAYRDLLYTTIRHDRTPVGQARSSLCRSLVEQLLHQLWTIGKEMGQRMVTAAISQWTRPARRSTPRLPESLPKPQPMYGTTTIPWFPKHVNSVCIHSYKGLCAIGMVAHIKSNNIPNTNIK